MDVSNISIGEIGLSVRSYNALRRAGIETVGQLLECNEESLLQIRNLGRKSIDEILLKMEEYRNFRMQEIYQQLQKLKIDIRMEERIVLLI